MWRDRSHFLTAVLYHLHDLGLACLKVVRVEVVEKFTGCGREFGFFIRSQPGLLVDPVPDRLPRGFGVSTREELFHPLVGENRSAIFVCGHEVDPSIWSRD